MYYKGLLFLSTCIATVKTDVGEFFDSKLTIEGPVGTLFPGDKAQFTCTAKKFEGNQELIWHWHFHNRSSFHAEVFVDPENDHLQFNDSVGITRTSVILIPDFKNIGFIGCALSTQNDHSHEKMIAVKILASSPKIQRQYSDNMYPQVVLELYRPAIKKPVADFMENSTNNFFYQHSPHLVTNQTVDLSPDVKSIKLSCFVPQSYEGKYEWTVFSGDKKVDLKDMKTKIKPQKSAGVAFVLSHLALIYREAVIAGRLPHPNQCDTNADNSTRNMFPEMFSSMLEKLKVLQVIMPPLVQMEQTLTYTCQPKGNTSGFSGFVTITNLATRTGVEVEGRDKEFLELINIFLQILQASSGSGGNTGNGTAGSGSGPLYGLGFGSSSIMVLMGLTIFYLKRQLNQLQDQIKENEQRKRLKHKTRPEDETDSEL